jgi:potassium-transporting ATPase ATP-binding subunit
MNVVASRTGRPVQILTAPILSAAIRESFAKLDPRVQVRNPVMFVVYLGSLYTTLIGLAAGFGAVPNEGRPAFVLSIAAWLWLTVLFANFAEAVAEGRGKAQAATLRSMRQHVHAKRLRGRNRNDFETVEAAALKRDDLVLVQANDVIPADGEIVEGVASVNESAVTGESAPVLREAGGDFSAVTGGTKVLSDWLVVRITSREGEGFLDRMIALVEGAKRSRTPNEIALSILLAMMTIVFLLATATLLPFSRYAVSSSGQGSIVTATVLVALLVCLIPTTIGALLSAIGIAGMDRMVRANVIATSGRAIEAAGDVDVLLLDKTGTITLGDRHAVAFHPAPRVDARDLADAAQLASLADETPEGRSIVVLAKEKHQLRGREVSAVSHTFHKFSAQTRMSGVDVDNRRLRKGAADAIRAFVEAEGGSWPATVGQIVDNVARRGATPLVVAEAAKGARVLGVIELRDVVKGGIRERFAELREMGIKTIMVTGDNRLTAAAIAAEAGVDEFLAEATPEKKLELIRNHQRDGQLVAMCGDGTNDAPALAQADVAVAMNTGTQAAKEAGNMVDLDSNPTKLIEVVDVGKQMLVTRGALTTFSLANDVSKYFAIVPAAFATTYPALGALDVMQLTSPASAILSAVIFNALIILALVPLALRGVKTRAASAAVLLRRNLLIYGVGGVALPFIGIKLIDMLLALTGLA